MFPISGTLKLRAQQEKQAKGERAHYSHAANDVQDPRHFRNLLRDLEAET